MHQNHVKDIVENCAIWNIGALPSNQTQFWEARFSHGQHQFTGKIQFTEQTGIIQLFKNENIWKSFSGLCDKKHGLWGDQKWTWGHMMRK